MEESISTVESKEGEGPGCQLKKRGVEQSKVGRVERAGQELAITAFTIPPAESELGRYAGGGRSFPQCRAALMATLNFFLDL